MARILMVVRPSEGGAFGHVVRLGAALVDRGYQVAVSGPHGLNGANALDPRITVEHVDMVQPIAPLQDFRSMRDLAEVVRRFSPDLIHAHGSKAATLARLVRASNLETPLVFTPHQYAFANYFARRTERKAYEVIERLMAPLATRVLCVCEAERKLAERVGSGDRACVVYNGIHFKPAAEPDPVVAGLGSQGPVILAVAVLDPRKGVVSLLDAMPRVLAAHPSATLVVAGEGVARESLVRRVAALGIAPSVRLLGLVNDVPAALAGADVFVNPAWAEAFPYSVLEAMAVGLPIVATDVGGTGEAIEDGETGRLVAPRDPAALTEAILGLLADRDAAARLGAAARERMNRQFTFSGMVAGTIDVYGELGVPRLGNGSGPA